MLREPTGVKITYERDAQGAVTLTPDMLKQKFGDWVIVSTVAQRDAVSKGHIRVLCMCTKCRRVSWIRADSLTNGDSAGCRSCHAKERGAFERDRAQAKKDF